MIASARLTISSVETDDDDGNSRDGVEIGKYRRGAEAMMTGAGTRTTPSVLLFLMLFADILLWLVGRRSSVLFFL
jgi:hypothetical protein